MDETERCARFADWLEDQAEVNCENSTAIDFYRRVAKAMRDGKTLEQFIADLKAFRPEVDWGKPR